MTTVEIKRLKDGDRVHWHADETERGTVIEIGYNAVKVAWDDGQIGVVRHHASGDIHQLA